VGGALAVGGLALLRARRSAARHVRHIVLFRFKPGAPVEEISAAFDAVATDLSSLVCGYERGVQNSPEGLHNGGVALTHAFTLTFANEQDRDAYLPHPRHQHFVETYAKPHVESVCVFDYEVTVP